METMSTGSATLLFFLRRLPLEGTGASSSDTGLSDQASSVALLSNASAIWNPAHVMPGANQRHLGEHHSLGPTQVDKPRLIPRHPRSFYHPALAISITMYTTQKAVDSDSWASPPLTTCELLNNMNIEQVSNEERTDGILSDLEFRSHLCTRPRHKVDSRR